MILIENSSQSCETRPSKKEGIISSTDSKSVCSQEVVTDLLPETQSLLNVPNGDLVAVKIKGSNVQTNGQGIKESKREVAFTCVFKNRILYSNRRGQPIIHITNPNTTDSVCYASFWVYSYHSTSFAEEWNVRKMSIASFALDRILRRLCHNWCDERRTWTTKWNDIVFTDESCFCLQHYGGRIRVWRHRGERLLNCCVMLCHSGPAPCIMVWGGSGFHFISPLVCITGTLNSQCYISQVLEPVVLPYIQGFPSAIFQQDDELPHVALNGDTPPAATPDPLWQYVEVPWTVVHQRHIQRLFDSMLRCLAAVTADKGGYANY
ncbi:transposable element Tcb1 transposase [Trichonephila clavipes]|nr:transposable element Tcb1 transposase [Trichonephila clavipes]